MTTQTPWIDVNDTRWHNASKRSPSTHGVAAPLDSPIPSARILPRVLLSAILLYLTLALCGLGMGVMVIKYDLHRSEPWWLLLIAMVLGAGLMEVAGRVQFAAVKHLFHTSGGEFPSNIVLAFLAAATEEVAKFMVVCIVALCFRKQFDEPLDGLIYGSFAGLGCALAESFATLGFGQQSAFLPAQEPVRLAGHLIMGGIGCFGLGLLTSRSRLALLAIPAGLTGAVLLHWLWDIIAFDAADRFYDFHSLRGQHTLVPIALMVCGMAVFRGLVKVGAALTHVHLEKQSTLR